MELFKGYVSFGPHLASAGIPRLPQIREGLMATYQPGARNIYFVESATRRLEMFERVQQIYQAQPESQKSLLLAQMQAHMIDEREIQRRKAILAKYKADLERDGPTRTQRDMLMRNPSLEISELFSVAEYEMLDELSFDPPLEFDSEAFNPKDMSRNMFLKEQWERPNRAISPVILAGNVSAGLGLTRSIAIALGESLSFRNTRITDRWNQYREQAIQDARPTRLGSRLGLGHATIRNRLPDDDWVFVYDFDPSLHPDLKIAMVCELNPKKVPSDADLYPVLLGKVTQGRFVNLDAGEEERLIFLQELLRRCTPADIKQFIRRIPRQGLTTAFDRFVQDRGLVLPSEL